MNVLNGSKSSFSKSSRLNALFLQQSNKKRVRPLSKLRTEKVCPPFFLLLVLLPSRGLVFWEKQGRHNILLQLVSCVFSEFGISDLHLFYNCACNHHHTPYPPHFRPSWYDKVSTRPPLSLRLLTRPLRRSVVKLTSRLCFLSGDYRKADASCQSWGRY